MNHNNQKPLKIEKPKDTRLIYYYANQLRDIGLTINSSPFCPSDMLTEINELIQSNNYENYISDIKNNAEENLIEIENFNWIESDVACCYVWNLIKKMPTNLFLNNDDYTNFYDRIFPLHNPTSTTERYEMIIKFFDVWNTHKQNKLNFIHTLKTQWSNTLTKKQPFKWLQVDNEELCDWVWEYLIRAGATLGIATPINNSEKYIFCHSAFHTWSASLETKELFLIKISKAKNQLLFRRKLNKKKSLNIYIEEKAKDNLEHLCKITNRKINETIEYLINEEYKKHVK
ncbi:hypothetical protein [Tolumonas osonensis]|uniref:Uncharacterized protein n=1 Tax=Tolumonas osonensis TaxID=675874 RepID=A0A841GJJ9_9GAMM|nr:hypothetical protein [Tolumonas osonensis]MBB6055381.1 hypothetical protein [Tolumonas osonensis]